MQWPALRWNCVVQLVAECAALLHAEYMRSIKAMDMDALDPEIIAAARARRSRER